MSFRTRDMFDNMIDSSVNTTHIMPVTTDMVLKVNPRYAYNLRRPSDSSLSIVDMTS